jgi:putative ABC transport system permease protein
MDALIQDIRYATRRLIRSPGFTLVAIVTLALGIGANTAVFSVINAVLLTPPPFVHPEQLMLLRVARASEGSGGLPFSYPTYADLRERSKAFEEMGAWMPFGNFAFSLTGEGEPERVSYSMGTASLFDVLRVRPTQGRLFTRAEDTWGSGQRVVLLSDGLWKRRFAGDPSVVGKSMTLDGNPYTVVGVLPREFAFVNFPRAPDLWLPMALDPGQGRRYARGVSYLGVIGRLRAGTPVTAAVEEVKRIGDQIAAENPGFDEESAIRLQPLSEAAVGSLRTALAALLAAVALVLLIACANVANLLLARATAREREIAIRSALGEGRRRLARSLLTESALLGLVGGVVGIGLAAWGVSLFATMPIFGPSAPMRPYMVSAEAIHLDWRVLAFTLMVSILTGLVFGALPAFQIARSNLQQAVKAGASAERKRAREILVVSEIALSVVLLASAGVLVRSLVRLSNVDPGFRADQVLAIDLSLPPSKYPDAERLRVFFDQLLGRVAGLPGVQHVGVVDQPPLGGPVQSTDYRVEGQAPPAPGTQRGMPYSVVTPDYFRTMGIEVRSGRGLEPSDDANGARVAVVNEAIARRVWAGENPIGKRLTLSVEALRVGPRGEVSWDWTVASREVVGVVAAVRHEALSEDPTPETYLPFAQTPVRVVTLVVRSGVEPSQLAASVRREVQAIDPTQPISRVRTMDDVVKTSIGAPRFRTILFAIFAGLAVTLAVVGIYGVTAYSVTQRTREIGIRMAMGAKAGDIRELVVLGGLRLTVLGVLIGIAGALVATRLLTTLLFETKATDPLTFVVVSLLLAAVTAIACYLPARRAARVDPVVALRSE